MGNILLIAELLPIIAIPFVYLVGRKSSKAASYLIAFVAFVDIILFVLTVQLMSGSPQRYVEPYNWIPSLNTQYTLFVDGISVSIVIITLILVIASSIFSPRYFGEKHRKDAGFYTLLMMLTAGLVGVFITSIFLFFYFNWEFMLIPAYFIIGGWGYSKPYKTAFKFFIFTHIGAVFVLLSIGAVYLFASGPAGVSNLDILDIQKYGMLNNAPLDMLHWVLILFTAGFGVKMAIFPVHAWLPDAHSEAPAPMSALLSGVIISAGAYAILRICLQTVLPAVIVNDKEFAKDFLHLLCLLGIITAFYGSFIALVRNDIKRIIAYSSISHMGYIMFGLSLFPIQPVGAIVWIGITGAVLHIVTHAASKGLLFLSSGSIMSQLEIRDTREMGGLAGKMPWTATTTTTAALSIAGVPPLACFFSELLIFLGAFQLISTDSFYIWPTVLMLIAVIFSLAYILRFIARIFFGAPKTKTENAKDVPFSMKFAMVILAIVIVIIGIYPTFFIQLISTALTGGM